MGRMKPRKQFEAMGTISLWVQNLKQALRNLRSHGWQAGISAMGLAVGIVCLTFSLNWLWTETNYDYFRPGYKDLYLVQYNDSTRWTVSVVYNVAVQMDSLLEGKAEVGVVGMTSGIQVYPSGRKEDYFRASSLAASSGMVRALGLTVLSGDPEKALAMPGHVVLTESLARKIFGRTDAVGQTFETSGYGVDGTQAVGAVVADNEGRTFREYDMLSPLNVQESEREWNAFGLYMVYVRTEEPRVVEEAFSRIYLPQEKSYWKFRLIPLRTAHKVGYGESFLHAYFYPLAFTLISVLLLCSAVVNLLAVYTSVFFRTGARIRLAPQYGSVGMAECRLDADGGHARCLVGHFVGLRGLGVVGARRPSAWQSFACVCLFRTSRGGSARVGGGRDGLSRTQGAPGLSVYVGRRGFRRPFPRLAVGGAMFRVGFLAVHLFRHATPVVGDDEPRPWL